MKEIFLSALEVQLTSDKSLLLELATPAAIVIAAIAGAYFAAQYAGKNVAKELEAADLRLKRELRHDQILREKEAARRTLDEVTNVATDAMDALVDYSAKVGSVEEKAKLALDAPDDSPEKEETEEQLDEAIGELIEKMDSAHSAGRKLRPAHVRLQLRFPADHPISMRFAALISAIKASEVNERGRGPEPRTEDELAKAEGIRGEIPQRLNLYLEDARGWMDEVVDPE
ncbi:MAG TPA: hypothetical protein VFU16_08260 [Solirubrobacterales bacterium]|nr:hypothetical protein [Solirubrobacterales bacterium]